MIFKSLIPSTAATFCLFFISDRINLAASFYDLQDEDGDRHFTELKESLNPPGGDLEDDTVHYPE
jgi:hypothetical protein